MFKMKMTMEIGFSHINASIGQVTSSANRLFVYFSEIAEQHK